jgi:hypothetical protein
MTAPVVELLVFCNLTSYRHMDPVRLPKFRSLLAQCKDWFGDAVGPGLDFATGKELLGVDEMSGDVWGESNTTERNFLGRSHVILGGWESVEGHKAFQASEAFKERSGVDGNVEGYHVTFVKIKG